jgi:hypothetical protein
MIKIMYISSSMTSSALNLNRSTSRLWCDNSLDAQTKIMLLYVLYAPSYYYSSSVIYRDLQSDQNCWKIGNIHIRLNDIMVMVRDVSTLTCQSLLPPPGIPYN